MNPFGDFLYFGFALYAVVPTLLLRPAGRGARSWIILVTLAVLLLQYGGTVAIWPGLAVREIGVVAAYAALESAVAAGFLRLRAGGARRAAFYGALLLALLPLILTKWLPLFVPGSLPGFLGISYVTFRSLDVIFNIQDGLITRLPPLQYLAYLFFFPTLSSGPIDRYRRFAADWHHARSRAEFRADLDAAVQHVFRGLLYKFILAALIKQYWVDPAARGTGLADLLSYMYAYSLYLFFDFAGYSAFAVGFSVLFGIHTPENFDRPFLARNIRDFWNRWHITLSWWFRDHVYMRFVLAATRGRWFKDHYRASYLGFVLSFGLMGLWHGTAWYYLLYGFYHAGLLVGYDAYTRWRRGRRAWGQGPLGRVAAVALTFNLVCFGFLIFSGRLAPAAAPAPIPPGRYGGAVEAVGCEAIRGWAWDRTRPNVPIRVDIYSDETLLGTVLANTYRKDLYRAGKGTGFHGFTYLPPASLNDARPHPIRVRVAGTRVALDRSPQPLTCGALVLSMSGLDGVNDSADCRQIGGWAWDDAQPNTVVNVDIYDGPRRLATVPANRFRADLRTTAIGNGAHGFSYPVPSALKDGRMHILRVKIAGTNIDLQATVRVLTCLP